MTDGERDKREFQNTVHHGRWALKKKEKGVGWGGGVGPLPHGVREEKDKGGAGKSVDWRKTSSIKGEGHGGAFIHSWDRCKVQKGHGVVSFIP